jgi:ubiquinone/menaquinone biosynthesis C-methylase UbiE
MSAISRQKQDEFMDMMTRVFNLGALNLALGLGYKLGLFEAMAKENEPLSCAELAGRAGVSPRYLREWLGVMTCGRVVELSRAADGAELYFLPREHAACLIRGSKLNLGVYAQEIPLLTREAAVQVEKGFLSGQGVDYKHYPDFQDFMTELADAKHQETLVQTFLPSVDHGRLLEGLNAGIAVCDLGCGTGVAALLMARAFPNSRITGLDISAKAIQTAREEARNQGLANLEYELADASLLHADPAWGRRFDYITAFDAIHDQTRPHEALLSVRHLLKPGGLFSMIDIKAGSSHGANQDHPMGAFLYAVSLMHCMPVGLNDQGAGLGMMWGAQTAMKMLEDAGFARVELVDMPFDPFNQHYLCRR